MRILLSAIALLAAPVAAQNDSAIVVTGQKGVEKQFESFVDALTPTSPRGEIGRFEPKICPGVFGMPEARRTEARERIRMVAKGVGLDVGDPKCKINLLVVVAPEKASFLKILSKRYAYIFGRRTPSEIRRLIAEPGPATAWHIEEMLNGDGRRIFDELGVPINRTTQSPSRITSPRRRVFMAAAVVIEAGAIEGLTPVQIADYAAMRAFARIDPGRIDASTPPTILRILDAPPGSALPVTMTHWDFNFLKGLYSSPDNLYAPSQRSEIRRVMEREMAQAGEGNTPRSE